MRISDWSSDVCSSDLDCIMANRDKRVVPGTGIEPVRSKIEGFSYHFGFRRQHVCCSWSGARLHHSLTTVGARRLLSTPSQSCKTGLGSALARMSKHPGLSPNLTGDRKSTRLNSSH